MSEDRRRRPPVGPPVDPIRRQGVTDATRTWLLCLAIVALVAPSWLLAQGPISGCEDGIANDDGTWEGGVSNPKMVMRFAGAAVARPLEGVCICWSTASLTPIDLDYDLVLYAADGPGGKPGTELQRVPVIASGVTGTLKFYSHDLSGLGLVLPAAPVYLGIAHDWAYSKGFLCTDLNGPSTEPVYLSDGAEPVNWTLFDISALFIRPRVGASTAGCNAGTDALFLQSGRFRVDACWETDSNSGTGKLADLSGTGATMWFFNPNNPELFVKVRDACVNPFNRYWFFAAGLTNVGVTIKVTDTLRGFSKTYTSAGGSAFSSVQDTDSFATCP